MKELRENTTEFFFCVENMCELDYNGFYGVATRQYIKLHIVIREKI